MTIFELRKIALDHACDDSRSHSARATSVAAPEVVLTRAQSYLEFLTGEWPASETKLAKKRR